MKRAFTVLTALAVLVALALPAFAGKGGIPGPPPDKPKPTTTTTMAVPEVCEFDNEGVLVGWDGSSQFQYRCQWIVGKRSLAQEFRIEDVGGDVEAVSIRGPSLAVTDIYPHSGDICERQHVRQADLAFSFEPVTLPADGNCAHSDENKPDTDGPDSFALTIGVQKVTPRDGKVQLVWLNYPG